MFRVNKNLCLFSPSGRYFALALQDELIINDSSSLEKYKSFAFADTIEHIEWAPNGQHIVCANFKRGIVQVFSLEFVNWKCKFLEGSAGLEKLSWAPNSRALILVSDLSIHLTIWSLNDHSTKHIWSLKTLERNMSINDLGKKLAVVVCEDGKDSVEIYKTESWESSRKLMCDKLFSIDGVSWSPNGELLSIWCSTIGKSRVLVYSVVTDSHIGAFSADEKSSDEESADFSSEKGIKGIENVVWNPSGQLLAIAGCNETVVVINHVTWSVILQLNCSPVIQDDNYLGKVFKEVTAAKKDWSSHLSASGIPEQHAKCYLEEVHERPISITIDDKTNDWNISIAKIDILEHSYCGKYLAVRHQLYPSSLFIWNLVDDCVDYILLKNPISGIAWEPSQTRLAIFSESSTIITWQPNKASCFESPRGMKIISGKWHPTGDILTLFGYNKISLMTLKD